MFRPLILIALLVACSPKTYTKVEIGMPYQSFDMLCRPTPDEVAKRQSTTAAQKETLAIVLGGTTERRDSGCVGTFTFVNSKLDSISR